MTVQNLAVVKTYDSDTIRIIIIIAILDDLNIFFDFSYIVTIIENSRTGT